MSSKTAHGKLQGASGATSSGATSSSKTDFKQLIASSDKFAAKKIESPFAKYNSLGQLTCIICNQVVKSELVWNAHLNSKTHIDNKNKLKSQLTSAGGSETPAPASSSDKKQPSNATVSQKVETKPPPAQEAGDDSSGGFKRPAPVPPSTNKQLLQKLIQEADEDEDEDEDVGERAKKIKLDNLVEKTDSIDLNRKVDEKVAKEEDESKKEPVDETEPGALPEGFFDDPDLDAKARGFSRAENLEAEYEEFKKIMQTEEVKSDSLIERDDNLRDLDRNIIEVDELITRWSKIENLHQMRETLVANRLKKKNAQENEKMDTGKTTNDSDSDSDVDLTEAYLSIRSKNIV